MNSFTSNSVDRSMRLVFDLHGIEFTDEITIHDISEILGLMGGFSRSIALHCIRVSNYSTAIGKRMRLSGREVKLLWVASLFHDIGKIKIPKEILNKPSKLTKEEYEVVKTHSRKGYEIVRQNTQMEELSNIILYHHERFDGSGYPTYKSGGDIPLLSRIIAVADSFDAMTTDRPYSMALSLQQAIDELERGHQTQFDGDIVDCFIDLLGSSEIKPKECNIAFGLV
ncbi:HD-GYP domain-containing protein [Lutispora sp.]|uniref:HD-GYP domain-containing protein n=1 Tax=Lutispora sp. TaxID=2828727 RepID=UPI0035679BEA